jgi:hypothetical protein
MAVHFAPPFSSFKLIHLDFVEVTSDNEVPILGFIFVFEVMDAENLITFLDPQVNMLAVVDGMAELGVDRR